MVGGALVDVVVDGGTVWVGDIERRASSAPSTRPPARPQRPAITVPAGVVRLAVAGSRLWVTGTDDQVTPSTAAPVPSATAVRVGNGPIGLAGAGPALWVANGDDGTVSRLDPGDGHPLGDAVATGHAPVAVGADGAVVWVLDQDGPGRRAPVRAADGRRLGPPVVLPLRPRGMAVAPAGVWVVGVDPPSAVLVPRS